MPTRETAGFLRLGEGFDWPHHGKRHRDRRQTQKDETAAGCRMGRLRVQIRGRRYCDFPPVSGARLRAALGFTHEDSSTTRPQPRAENRVGNVVANSLELQQKVAKVMLEQVVSTGR